MTKTMLNFVIMLLSILESDCSFMFKNVIQIILEYPSVLSHLANGNSLSYYVMLLSWLSLTFWHCKIFEFNALILVDRLVCWYENATNLVKR